MPDYLGIRYIWLPFFVFHPNEKRYIITERVDDVALLIGLMKKMGLQEIL
jgi:hypothetical protein